jgi:hypothetical protein
MYVCLSQALHQLTECKELRYEPHAFGDHPILLPIIYLLTYGTEPFLRSRQLCSHSRTSQHFMEPEGSLPCSQEPSTGPYLKPDRSSPFHPILSL